MVVRPTGRFRMGGLDGVRSSTSSLRASVAQSSHPELKPFCGHFLDAATARSMTGAAVDAWHSLGSSTSSFRAPVAQSSHPGLRRSCGHFLDAATARGMTGAQLLLNSVINEGGTEPTVQTAKQEALNAINQLPENTDMDEIMCRLYVLDKIRKVVQNIREKTDILEQLPRAAGKRQNFIEEKSDE